MGEIRPMANALVVWAEEGRVYKRENNGKSFNRRYQLLVSEWGNPPGSNTGNRYRKIPEGTWRTETSQYPEEKKSYEISKVAASEIERA